MKTLIITASSKTKHKFDEIPFQKSAKTFADSVDTSNKTKLLKARSKILKEFNFDKGSDTHSNMKSSSKIQYLPAFIRYKGRTFSKVSKTAWDVLNNQPNDFDCLILSAFYGIIRYNELIRNYEIKQVTKMPSGSKIGKFWKEQGAQDWVINYIKRNDIDHVKFVLSTSYSDIVNKFNLMQRLEDDLEINSEDQQFKQGGMRSMVLRGQYINNLLLGQL